MNTERIEIRAQREPWRHDSIAVWLAMHINGGLALAEPIAVRKLTDDDTVQPLPTLRITHDDAQQWMDELWRAGIRPSEGAGSAGQMQAVQAHLQDMRRLVFEPKETVVECKPPVIDPPNWEKIIAERGGQ